MQKTKVFIAYAREDEAFLHRLREYLTPLERNDAIETWYDGKIAAGEQWDEKIKTHLHAADLILLLVSAKSLASNYFYNEEMKDALARHERKEAIVVPVILNYCDWKETPIKELQAIPKNAKPINAWSNDSEAYYDVTQSIKKNIQTIQKRKKQTTTYAQSTQRQAPPDKKTEPISQNKNNIDLKKILKIALPLLIGIIGIFVVFNWKNKQTDANIKEELTDNITDDNAKVDETLIPPEGMVYVEGGTFTMGCTSEQSGCDEDERPTHFVTVDDFFIGEHEVTVEQFKTFIDATGYNTSTERGSPSRIYTKYLGGFKFNLSWRDDMTGKRLSSDEYDYPVLHVSWYDAEAYCNWMSETTGRTCRLPTEAEWEYAARGGIYKENYMYSGSDELDGMWCSSMINYEDIVIGTRQVKTSTPNALGLYDMSGNAFEWCQDWYGNYDNIAKLNPRGTNSGINRVLRGGSWRSFDSECRVSNRDSSTPSSGRYDISFRIISTVDY